MAWSKMYLVFIVLIPNSTHYTLLIEYSNRLINADKSTLVHNVVVEEVQVRDFCDKRICCYEIICIPW